MPPMAEWLQFLAFFDHSTLVGRPVIYNAVLSHYVGLVSDA